MSLSTREPVRHVADVIATQTIQSRRNAEELDLHSQLLVPGVYS